MPPSTALARRLAVAYHLTFVHLSTSSPALPAHSITHSSPTTKCRSFPIFQRTTTPSTSLNRSRFTVPAAKHHFPAPDPIPNHSFNSASAPSLSQQAADIVRTTSTTSRPPPFSVFISHAGEDKFSIAIPLRQKLARLNIPAFVDKMDMAPGSHVPSALAAAMVSTPVAVFVLSDEFIAKKWPILELFTFLYRVQSASQTGQCPPKLIPFFYRLSRASCTDPSLFWRTDTNGCPAFAPSHAFAHRLVNGELSLEEVFEGLQQLCKWVGVKNVGGVTNEDSVGMKDGRDKLIDELVDAIQAGLED